MWGGNGAAFSICLVNSAGKLKTPCQPMFGGFNRSESKVTRDRTVRNVPTITLAREGDCYQLAGGRVGEGHTWTLDWAKVTVNGHH
jgi:hypothetical protein